MTTKEIAVSLTPYAAHTLVNEKLAEAGILNKEGKQKRIPPQMMYNYSIARKRQGKVPFIPVQADDKILKSDIDAWIAKYIAKQLKK